MLGQNGWPEDYDPMVDALDENKVSDQIDPAASAIAHAAGALRTRFDCIRAIGADARGNA